MICEWFLVRGQIRLQKKLFFLMSTLKKLGVGGLNDSQFGRNFVAYVGHTVDG